MKGIRNMTATDNLDGAISIKEFCKRNSIGVTSAYAEIADGKLIARKCRGRTLIALADERTWRANLPKMTAAAARNSAGIGELDRARRGASADLAVTPCP